MLALAIWLLTAVDLLLTKWGFHLGVFVEANPFLDHLFAGGVDVVPLGLICTTFGLCVMHIYRSRAWVRAVMWGFLVIRVGIVGLHAMWIRALWA